MIYAILGVNLMSKKLGYCDIDTNYYEINKTECLLNYGENAW